MDNIIQLNFPHKKIRSRVIKDYMKKCGYNRAVCFTCGNAAKELKEIGVDVLEIGENGVLSPKKWFTIMEISRDFPTFFDATCGHLPFDLMLSIAKEYKNYLGFLEKKEYNVLTGSGETIVCLKIAYPEINFNAIYNRGKETEYNLNAPLNKLVELLAGNIFK